MNNLIEQINDILQQMQKKNQKLKPAMAKVAGMVADMINENFAAKGRWDGDSSNITILSGGNQKWTDLSSGYKERILEFHNTAEPTLYRTGALKRSIEVNATAKGIQVTANTPYARIHQLGGEIDHPGGTPYLAFGDRIAYIKKTTAERFGDRVRYTKAHTITIPPRPYLTIRPDDLQKILDFMVKFVLSRS